MRIYMQQPPQKDVAPRYVQLLLEQDLLGGWTLYRESGNQGGRATLRRQVFIERDDAIHAFEHARDLQIKKGFKIMITEGMEAPSGH